MKKSQKPGKVYYQKLDRKKLRPKPYSLPDCSSNDDIPSYQGDSYSTAKKEPRRYTGNVVIGIVGTHKSNDQPVTSKQAVIDASTMRRGHYGGTS